MSDNTNLEQGALPLFKEKPNEATAPLEREAKRPAKPSKGSIDPERAVADTFAANKDVELLYFTSNGWAFFTEDKAQEAAATLPDKKVKKVFNPTKRKKEAD